MNGNFVIPFSITIAKQYCCLNFLSFLNLQKAKIELFSFSVVNKTHKEIFLEMLMHTFGARS